MAVLRELIGELSFNADTTGATRFDQAVNRSKNNLNSLNAVSLAPFARNLASVWGLVGAAVTAGAVTSTKQFIDIEKAYDALEIRAKDSTGTVRETIQDILNENLLKNLVNEIDLVTGAFQGAQEGADAIQINRFLRLATILKTLTPGGNIGDFLKQLTSGDVESLLKTIGQLPLELQEIFKAGGIGPGQIGLIGRRELAEQRLLGVLPELEARIAEQRERGLTTFDELGGVLNKLSKVVGEGTLPAFQDLNDLLIPFVESLTKGIGTEETREQRRKEVLKEAQPDIDAAKQLLEDFKFAAGGGRPESVSKFADQLLKDFTEFDYGKLNPFRYLSTRPVTGGLSKGGNATTTNDQGIKIDKIEIRVEGGNTDAQTGQNVAKEVRKIMGTISEQSKQATPKRGGN